ncbi:MAG: serine protease [Roseiarcus sp.]|jgi:hypothetical protein
MTKIDPFSLTTVPIEQFANGKMLGAATSFVWKRGAKHYLITNWHVVTGCNAQTRELLNQVRPDSIRAHFNSRRMDYGKVRREIRIRDEDHKPLWCVHPIRKNKSDIVAIPLEIDDDTEIGLYPINSMKSEADLAVTIGMDVFILGYPFGNIPPGFPVWKRGSVASEPDLVNLDRGFLLVDTASRPGMSGAPVIRRSWGAHTLAGGGTSSNGTPQSKLVGVYSGRLHTNDTSDAQLGMVWPASDIEDIVSLQARDD